MLEVGLLVGNSGSLMDEGERFERAEAYLDRKQYGLAIMELEYLLGSERPETVSRVCYAMDGILGEQGKIKLAYGWLTRGIAGGLPEGHRQHAHASRANIVFRVFIEKG